MKDFFISYNSADKSWAEWIAWQLEEAEYTTILQAWDFRPGHNFPLQMDKASQEAERIVIVLSHDFLDSSFTPPEWAVFFKKDPTGEKGLIVPVRVRKCELGGLLSTINRIDLIGLKEEAAKNALLDGVKFERAKPSTPPGFPGSRSVTEKPRFPGALPPVWNVPFNRNPNFTGRRSLLTDLHDALNSGQYAALTQAITGLGGVGKTQLALEYVYSYINEYEIVWWLRSEEPSTLAAEFADLALRLNLPEKDEANQEVLIEAVKKWLGQNRRWLLVFDNALDPKEIKSFLPQGAGGHVIITSRNPVWGNLARSLKVTKFERSESIEFLLKRTGQEDRKAANDLAEALGDLPLALEQAGAYIETTAKPLNEYLAAFQKRKLEVLAKGKPSDYPETVATTWDISFEAVKNECPAASKLLRLCSYLAPDDIPIELLVKGRGYLPDSLEFVLQDEDRLDEALAALRRYSLIDRRGDKISVHRLVQAVTRDQLSEGGRKGWAAAAMQMVNDDFPENIDYVHTWPECSLLLPHALAMAEHAEEYEAASEATKCLLYNVGIYLVRRGNLDGAKSVFEKVLSIYEMAYGPDSTQLDEAGTLITLGSVLARKGDLDGAKCIYEKVLAVYEMTYGPDSTHPNVAKTFTNLGNVLFEKGDLDGAKSAYEKALSIYETDYGLDSTNSDVAGTLMNLGNVLAQKGDLDGAKCVYEKALAIYEMVYGPDSTHPDVAMAYMNLGIVLFKKGDLDGAESAYEKALAIYEMAYGPDSAHPDVATTLMNLGNVLFEKGDLDGARSAYEKVLSIYETVYGLYSTHPDVAMAHLNFGNVLFKKGDINGAESAYEKALAIYEMVYGPDSTHPDVAGTLMNLGNVLAKKGDLDKAKSAFEKVLAIYEMVYGPDSTHPNVAGTLMDLGNVLFKKGDLNGAKSAFEKVLTIYEMVYGPDSTHPNVAGTLMNLGNVLFRKGDLDRAKSAYEKALVIFREGLGDDDTYTMMVRYSLEALDR